jgi:hypothetical protein
MAYAGPLHFRPGGHKSRASGRQVAQASKLCRVMPNILSITANFLFITHKNMYQSTRTQQNASDNSTVHRLLQNLKSSVWNPLHVTIPAPRIWRWLLDVCKLCGPPVRANCVIHTRILSSFDFVTSIFSLCSVTCRTPNVSLIVLSTERNVQQGY